MVPPQMRAGPRGFHGYTVFIIWHQKAALSDYTLTVGELVLCVLQTASHFQKCLQCTCFLLSKCVLSKTVLPPLKCHNRAYGSQVSTYVKKLLTILSTAPAQLAFLEVIGTSSGNSLGLLQSPRKFPLHWWTSCLFSGSQSLMGTLNTSVLRAWTYLSQAFLLQTYTCLNNKTSPFGSPWKGNAWSLLSGNSWHVASAHSVRPICSQSH